MQAIVPVDVHVENGWRNDLNVRKQDKPSNLNTRMRTRVLKKTNIPKQNVKPKIVSPRRSHSSSSNRVPRYILLIDILNICIHMFSFRVSPYGRSTKGQKISWQVG